MNLERARAYLQVIPTRIIRFTFERETYIEKAIRIHKEQLQSGFKCFSGAGDLPANDYDEFKRPFLLRIFARFLDSC